MRHIFLLFGLTAVFACSEDPATAAPTKVGDVVFSAKEPEIRITNKTTKPVFTMIVGKNISPLLDWFPCVDAAVCPPVPPGATAVKQFSEGHIDAADKEALVYWWHAVMKDGQLQYDELRMGVLRVR